MGQLTFPMQPDGSLVVDVLVNVGARLLITRRARGLDADPVQVKGLIDTGSNVTVVSASVLRQLGVRRRGKPRKTTGISGSVHVHLYRVSLHVRDAAQPTLRMFTHPSLLVMKTPSRLDGAHDVVCSHPARR